MAVRLLTAVLVAVLLAVAPALGLAGPPYITDDTGTQGRGNWQLELVGEHIHHDRTAISGGVPVSQNREVTAFGPVLTYGVTEDVDLAFGVGRLRDRITENGVLVQDAEGTSDSVVEIKWRFYERNGLSFAVKPGLALPTGDESRGLGTGEISWGVNGILTFETGSWTWLANLAYTEARFKQPEDQQSNHRYLWRLSGGLGYQLHQKLKLAAEAGIRTNPAKDDPFLPGHNGHFGMIGVIYSPTDNIDIAAGLRKNASEGESDTAFPFGVTFRW
ncbi:MAG: transporter [Kiloniellales bacterium]|nr:transporter [Kiloniellales bacterium]